MASYNPTRTRSSTATRKRLQPLQRTSSIRPEALGIALLTLPYAEADDIKNSKQYERALLLTLTLQSVVAVCMTVCRAITDWVTDATKSKS